METCSGDDISYQIPIATTVTFDGVEYSNIYATTNSVITFGQPDPTYWAYPNTPSISLYSMDWYPGANNTSGLDIYYSEGGFQINLNMVPFGSWNAEPSTVNILVAVTNTGGISVAYSYQGPEYQNLRTGVRLHDGSIVSLEAWGATQIEEGDPTPTLAPEPIPEPSPSPTGPTQEELEEQARQAEEQARQEAEQARVQEEIRVVNNLLAAAAGSAEITVIPPVEEPVVEPELPPVDSADPEETIPEPDVVVEPEVITPEDPEFPEDIDVPNQPDETNQEPDSETNDEQTDTPVDEPSNKPQPEDTEQPATDEQPDPQPSEDPVQIPDNTPSKDDITEGANLLADLSSADSFIKMTEEQKDFVSKTLGIETEELELVADLAKSDPAVASALESFAEKLIENADAPMPYTLADAIVEERMDQLLSNPGAVLSSMLDVDLSKIFSDLSSLGSDMTDDQREKAQEVIVPVIIASNIVAAAMTRRK